MGWIPQVSPPQKLTPQVIDRVEAETSTEAESKPLKPVVPPGGKDSGATKTMGI